MARLKYASIILFLFILFFFWLRKNPAALIRGALTPVSVFSQITGRNLKSADGRTNILLLGLDRRHDAAITGKGLTDTIMVISVAPRLKDAAVLSLPRDLWSRSAGYKINALYSAGGISLIRSVLEKMLDIPLHYYTVADFAAFEKAIDLLGGVEIDVPDDFVDDHYPLPGREKDTCGLNFLPEADAGSEFDYPCRFEKISFPKGTQKMSGAAALKYARSRHAPGESGTDFARARRQQQILGSLAKESFSWGTLLNPGKMKDIFDSFQASVETNLGFWEAERFYTLGRDLDLGKVRTAVLDTGNVLVHSELSPEESFQWVLAPRAGDFSEVALFVQRLFFGEGR